MYFSSFYFVMSNNKNRILKHHKTVPEMKIASWNIRTLLPDTKTAASRPERRTALIASELGRLGIDIACLSETRLADEGRIDEVGSGYSFFGRVLMRVSIVEQGWVLQLKVIL